MAELAKERNTNERIIKHGPQLMSYIILLLSTAETGDLTTLSAPLLVAHTTLVHCK
jgi:hypothetical protein